MFKNAFWVDSIIMCSASVIAHLSHLYSLLAYLLLGKKFLKCKHLIPFPEKAREREKAGLLKLMWTEIQEVIFCFLIWIKL